MGTKSEEDGPMEAVLDQQEHLNVAPRPQVLCTLRSFPFQSYQRRPPFVVTLITNLKLVCS